MLSCGCVARTRYTCRLFECRSRRENYSPRVIRYRVHKFFGAAILEMRFYGSVSKMSLVVMIIANCHTRVLFSKRLTQILDMCFVDMAVPTNSMSVAFSPCHLSRILRKNVEEYIIIMVISRQRPLMGSPDA